MGMLLFSELYSIGVPLFLPDRSWISSIIKRCLDELFSSAEGEDVTSFFGRLYIKQLIVYKLFWWLKKKQLQYFWRDLMEASWYLQMSLELVKCQLFDTCQVKAISIVGKHYISISFTWSPKWIKQMLQDGWLHVLTMAMLFWWPTSQRRNVGVHGLRLVASPAGGLRGDAEQQQQWITEMAMVVRELHDARDFGAAWRWKSSWCFTNVTFAKAEFLNGKRLA